MPCDPETLLETLKSRVTEPFVHGRGKRKTQIQRDIEELASLLARKGKYETYQKTFKGRNSFSKTDPDATFMHMKEDHMRNAQLKPGYNVQFAVEGEYITGVTVSSERSDQLTLIETLEIMYNNLGDYYFLAGDDEPEEEIHIGVFGQLRHKYLRENKKCVFTAMLLSGKLMQHLKETDEYASSILSQLVSQMAKAEGVTEELKAKDQMKWIGLMENIHNRAMEIVCAGIIYA